MFQCFMQDSSTVKMQIPSINYGPNGTCNPPPTRHLLTTLCPICTWLFQNTPQVFKFRHALNESRLCVPHTLIPPLHSVPSHSLRCIDFQSFSSTHLTKPSHHRPQVLLRLITQNQVICTQKATLSHPPGISPPFFLFSSAPPSSLHPYIH